jgi:threonine/homoserine/homoserine lactone efflux protein
MITTAFVVTCALIVVVPGPALAVLMSQSLRSGTAAGLSCVAGNTTGLVVWACGAAFGLTALLTASTVGFVVLKVIGAVYLAWLGVHALTRRRSGSPDRPVLKRPSRVTAYRSGLLTSITNPKPAALYMALLPQFMPSGATVGDVFELASVHIVLSATWYILVVVGVVRARRLLEHPVAQRWLDRLTGSVFLGLAVRLAVAAR